ncbi:MAG: phage major capsid protein [Oscillospiraceae bacterium]|nr:phage major capsid protein [Oscillospiraceae bacterium]
MSGTPTNRTNISLPTDVSREIISKTQETSAIMRLARKVDLPGQGVSIPVIVSDPEAQWVGETNKKPVSNPELSTKILRGYKLAVIVPFSNEFRRDLSALYSELVSRLPNALGKKFDQTVFGAVEKPGSDFDTFAEITAQSLASDPYQGLVAADTDISLHGGVVNGYAISPQARGILLAATDTSKRPLFVNNVAEGAIPMILGARTVMSKGAFVSGSPSTVGVAGDWTQALYGTVEGVKVDISDQATLDLGGGQVLYLFQQNMFAVRAEIEVGFRADTSVFNALTASDVPSI